MVPYLHITTRIEGQPYDKLLSEKGGTGFPTLMFLDHEGRKLRRHAGPRTIKGFLDSLVLVDKFRTLMDEAADGDEKAATEVLIRQLELQWFDYEEASERAGELKKVSKKQQEQIDQLLVDTEVRSIAAAAGTDPAKRLEAGAHFLAMWKNDRVPAADAECYSFWFLMADHAEDQGDKKLFKKIVGESEDALKGNSRYRRALKALEMRLDDFRKK